LQINEYIKTNPFLEDYFNSKNINIKDLTNGINEVFLLEDGDKKLILKRALPYFKQYGPKHPLDESRVLFEAKALEIFKKNNKQLIPKLYLIDEKESLILVEYIKDKISLNQFLQSQLINKNFSEQLSDFLCKNFFHTSTYGIGLEKKQKLLDTFQGNNHMKELSVQFIFTDIINRYKTLKNTEEKTNNLIDELNMQESLLVKNMEILREKFILENECLLHGDLKGGSILLNDEDISIIDCEFSSYGPIAYDLSSIIYVFVSLIINYDLAKGDKTYISWLISVVEEIFYKFKEKLLSLNKDIGEEFFDNLIQDIVGFMGIQMLSMMIPHVVPFKTTFIKKETETIYYKKMDLIAKIFIKRYKTFNNIEQVLKVIQSHLQHY